MEEERKRLIEDIKAAAPDMPTEVSAYLDRVNEPTQLADLRTVLREQTGEPIRYSYNEHGVSIENGSLSWTHSEHAYAFGNAATGEQVIVQHNPKTNDVRGMIISGEDGERGVLDVTANAAGELHASYRGDDLDMKISGHQSSAGNFSGNFSLQSQNEDGVSYSAKAEVKRNKTGVSVSASSVDYEGEEPEYNTVNVKTNGHEDSTKSEKLNPVMLAMHNRNGKSQ